MLVIGLQKQSTWMKIGAREVSASVNEIKVTLGQQMVGKITEILKFLVSGYSLFSSAIL